MPRATQMRFEKRCLDDSGVEYGISLQNDKVYFERWGHSVNFPEEQLQWILDCLVRIETELDEPSDEEKEPVPTGGE